MAVVAPLKIKSLDGRVIECLQHEHNPDKAMTVLINHYKDAFQDASKIYTSWKRVRSKLLRNESNRSKKYTELLITILESLNPVTVEDVHDYHSIKSLLSSSLIDQHKTYLNAQRKTLDMSPHLQDRLAECPPVQKWFYGFNVPEELVQEVKEQEEKRMLDKHSHKSSRSQVFSVSPEYLSIIKGISLNLLDISIRDGINKSKDFADLVVALQIVSGRRLHELLITLELQGCGPSEYSAVVKGICKKPRLEQDVAYTIPLLCTYEKFRDCLDMARKFKPEVGAVKPYTVTLIGKSTKRLFGKGFDHTAKRNLYCEMTWAEKDKSNAMEIGSKKLWFVKALCHNPSKELKGVTDCYTSMNIESSEP